MVGQRKHLTIFTAAGKLHDAAVMCATLTSHQPLVKHLVATATPNTRRLKQILHAVFVQVSASTFGSVPLKTYLPDGDIDISMFVKHQPDNLKESWAQQLQVKLDDEASNPVAPFRISDVQIINAEVNNTLAR